MSDQTITISRFIADTKLSEIPASVQHQAKRTLLNFFGCACGGAENDAILSVLRARTKWQGRGTSTVIGHSAKVDPLTAALVNGMSSAVYSFDDTHHEALVHPGGPVASAALAFGEASHASGAEFLAALIIGAELVCRLSKAVSVPPAQARTEWVQTGICGGVGAAAAGARLSGFDVRRITSSLSIAACRSAGYRALSKSMCFSYMAGTAAEAGLMAALAVAEGMVGSEEPFFADAAFLSAFSGGANPSALLDGLGARWEFADLTFKPYPCGVVIHPIIDACLSLAADGLDPQSITSIEVTANPAVVKLANIPEPVDQFTGQMSVQHWVAVALLTRSARPEHTQHTALFDKAIMSLRHRVNLKADAALARSAIRVSITLEDGRTRSASANGAKGGLENPLSDQDIEEKFRLQAVPVLGQERAERIARACWSLENIADIADIAQEAVRSPA